MKLILSAFFALSLIGCSQDSTSPSKDIKADSKVSAAVYSSDGFGIAKYDDVSSYLTDPVTHSNYPVSSALNLSVVGKNYSAGSIILGINELGSSNLNIVATGGSGDCLNAILAESALASDTVYPICDFEITEKVAKEGKNSYNLSLMYKDGATDKYHRKYFSIAIEGQLDVSDAAGLVISTSDLQFGSVEGKDSVKTLVLSNASKTKKAPIAFVGMDSLVKYNVLYNSCGSELDQSKSCIVRFSIGADKDASGLHSESFTINGISQALSSSFPEVTITPPAQALELELSATIIDLGNSFNGQEMRTIVVKNTTEYDLPSLTLGLNDGITKVYDSCSGKVLDTTRKCIVRFLLDPNLYSESVSFVEVDSLPYASNTASIYVGDGSDINENGTFTVDAILGARIDGDHIYVSGANDIVINGTCDANKDLSIISPIGTQSITCDGSGEYSHTLGVESIHSSDGDGFWKFTIAYVKGLQVTKTVLSDSVDEAKMPPAVFDVTRFDQSVFQ